MNRGDARLVIAILSTAVLTAGATTLVWYNLSSSPQAATVVVERPTSSATLEELQALRDRVDTLENRYAHPKVADRIVVDDCDEVSCVLNNYEQGCCARFKLDADLGREQISRTIAGIKGEIFACGDKVHATGKMKIHVAVAPDGHVISTHVDITPDPALGSCVAHIVERTRFEPTRNGGKFSYPFVF